MERKTAWLEYNEQDEKNIADLSLGYMEFLDNGKTERECAAFAVAAAEKAGYKNLDSYIENGKKLQAGDKVYAVNMGKAVALFNIGTEPLAKGMNILGAHIDSPRLDVKQNPLYESGGLAYFDTHYYGGIKKYQWVTLPLAIHGVVAKKDGTVLNINIGENESEPVFCVTDLLIHLAQKQQKLTADQAVKGEDLDLLIGSIPKKGEDKDKDKVKKLMGDILKEKYNFEEEDLLSAELEIVPAGKARYLGIDKSMVIAYGQDDRVCAYASLAAMLATDSVKTTTCCLLVDKEEIGSVGATGMNSNFFENTVAEILELTGGYSDLAMRRTLKNSRMLSSDVSAGYDPLYESVFDKKNSAYLGKGLVFNKYTGARGKSGSNDANAEYVAKIRRIMDDNNVFFQTAELGKVDAGGGGTIAYIMSLYGMEVIDCGVAVLSMHAPWEVVSLADVYEAKKGYVAFLQEA
jgi:aspartyl aminopeptidase